jgi:hypothetical protein
MSEKLTYRFTKDEKILRQFYRVRKIAYDLELGINIPLIYDDFDNSSETLIAIKDGECVGGIRLTVSTPTSYMMLPAEDEEFHLAELLPELDLHNNPYAEFSRLVLLPQWRGSTISPSVYRQLSRKARQQGVRYVFILTDRHHATLYMRSQRTMHYGVKILNEIRIPESVKERHDNLVDCLVMIDLTPQYEKPFVETRGNVLELSSFRARR